MVCFVCWWVNQHEEVIEPAPAVDEISIGYFQIFAGFQVGILNNEDTFGFIVAGDEQIMPHPGDFAGVIPLVVAFFDQHREAVGQEAFDHLDLSAVSG